ncbi:hypothetical protein NEHOM01_0265 [Nematocida homosporus]|uniref:uncharacterized protein n=1 Tax=Nematocida homosporus TaxID=1912981 RepID=UPI0022205DEB|nr:uncharacterized protein NEHOM01_0265 [Nematocida homosporus]KAI5184590.1 hypothetical protein NEHOM01_0265 [Nematocida homosporus]
MDQLETMLIEALDSLDEKIERIGTVSLIMDHIIEIGKLSERSVNIYELEEYYIEQINRWMEKYEIRVKEAEEKEVRALEREKQYLSSLKKIRELEKTSGDTQTKYEYLKRVCQPKMS